ncbi:unnamed protein product [Heligmosomoides polygyrus]|uniref:Uncharacterized protein n=1 Tax=Heligmosomoides polygyrus TaxID=6339 RepID=A0A183G0P3_HELPZ|nr:unnamed protein product [Heligmosomoides polygyrus]
MNDRDESYVDSTPHPSPYHPQLSPSLDDINFEDLLNPYEFDSSRQAQEPLQPQEPQQPQDSQQPQQPQQPHQHSSLNNRSSCHIKPIKLQAT